LVANKFEILLVSSPGLRRDTLLALLRLSPGVVQVQSAETIIEGEKLLAQERPTLVIVDHSLGDKQLKQAVPVIRWRNPKAWILFLVRHPREVFDSKGVRPDSIRWEGFSSNSLSEEIYKAACSFE
jgi:DNA-binding NarL/FixJ family response regulator